MFSSSAPCSLASWLNASQTFAMSMRFLSLPYQARRFNALAVQISPFPMHIFFVRIRSVPCQLQSNLILRCSDQRCAVSTVVIAYALRIQAISMLCPSVSMQNRSGPLRFTSQLCRLRALLSGSVSTIALPLLCSSLRRIASPCRLVSHRLHALALRVQSPHLNAVSPRIRASPCLVHSCNSVPCRLFSEHCRCLSHLCYAVANPPRCCLCSADAIPGQCMHFPCQSLPRRFCANPAAP